MKAGRLLHFISCGCLLLLLFVLDIVKLLCIGSLLRTGSIFTFLAIILFYFKIIPVLPPNDLVSFSPIPFNKLILNFQVLMDFFIDLLSFILDHYDVGVSRHQEIRIVGLTNGPYRHDLVRDVKYIIVCRFIPFSIVPQIILMDA